eukprot:2960851-Rhodomonas_salina.1
MTGVQERVAVDARAHSGNRRHELHHFLRVVDAKDLHLARPCRDVIAVPPCYIPEKLHLPDVRHVVGIPRDGEDSPLAKSACTREAGALVPHSTARASRGVVGKVAHGMVRVRGIEPADEAQRSLLCRAPVLRDRSAVAPGRVALERVQHQSTLRVGL